MSDFPKDSQFPQDLGALGRAAGQNPGVRITNRQDDENQRRKRIRQSENSRRQAVLELAGGMLALYAAPKVWQEWERPQVDFYTDFREPNTLQSWTSFAKSFLSIEDHNGDVAARPRGSNLVTKTANMTDGEFETRIDLYSPVKVLLRSADDQHGYVVGVTPWPQASKVSLKIEKLRKGEPHVIDGAELTNLRFGTLAAPWLRIKMDGNQFSAYLSWGSERPWGSILPTLTAERTQVLIHQWKDNNIKQGAVGLLGPTELASSFWVYSVSVKA